MNNSFDSLLKTACQIKSTYLNQDKKKFDSLPEFYKSGLYCNDMTKNIRNQPFQLKKISFKLLKQIGLNQIKTKLYDDAHYTFSKALAIFKYIKSSNLKWKTDGGIKDEELSYFEEKGSNDLEIKETNEMIISCLLNISFCDLSLGKWGDVREACYEVLKRDEKNVKA